MKSTSNVILGATLVMIVSIAIVLGLVLILLAELYCSLLLRRRGKHRASTSAIPISNVAAATAGTSEQHDKEGRSGTPSLSIFYAQGVINAPRNLLFPAVSYDNGAVNMDKQHSQLFELFEAPAQRPTSSPHYVSQEKVFSVPSSPSFPPLAPPKLVYKVPHHSGTGTYDDEICGGSMKETYMYICNPIYDNDVNRHSRVDTPFETPDSSPSRLETNGSSGDDDDHNVQPPNSSPSSPPVTPPLTPMKKLPAEACSITLRDARSLATSASESNSNNEYGGISSSLTSGSPCTSPSW